MKRKKLLLTIVVIVALGSVVIAGLILHNDRRYTLVNGYYDANNQYRCSRPIKARLGSIPTPGSATQSSAKGYIPVDPAEAARYCHVSGVF